MAGLKEPRRILPKRKIPFTNGLMKRDYDAVVGFVSDLKNMEINGESIQKRRGTKLMLPDDNTPRIWQLTPNGMVEMDVAGSKFLIGVNQKNQLYAVSSVFPECEFAVYSRWEINTATEIVFNRGDRFWFLDGTKFAYIVNNYYDIFRIDKKGAIEWWFGSKEYLSSTTYRYSTAANNVDIAVPNSERGKVYLDVLDVTHDEIEDIYVIDDIDEKFRPVKGQVYGSIVNNAGQFGPWKEISLLSDWKSCYFSLLPGISLGVENKIKSGFRSIEPSWTTVTNRLFAGFNGGTSRVGTSFSSNGDTSVAISEVAILVDPIEDFGTLYQTTHEGIYMFCKGGYFDPQYMQIKKCEAGKPVIDKTPSPDEFALRLIEVNHGFPIEILEDVTSEFTFFIDTLTNSGFDTLTIGAKTVIPATTATVISAGGANRVYKITGKTMRELADLYRVDVNNWIWKFGPYEFYANAQFKVSILTNVNLTFDDFTGTHNPYTHLGFDLWQTAPSVSLGVSALDYDIENDTLYIQDSSYDDYDVLLKDEENKNVGDRFAIWVDGKILRMSQRAHAEPQLYTAIPKILYDKDYEDLLSENNEKEMYNVPVMSLDYWSLEAQIAELPKAQWLPKNVEAIAMGLGAVFVYDGDKIYIADETFVAQNYVEVSSKVEHLVRIFDGVLAFTVNDVYRINPSGNKFYVPQGSPAKAVCFYEGSVVAVQKDNKVALYQVYYRENGSPDVRVDIISEPIKEISWNNPSVAYANETIWVADGNTIYGFYEGGWKKQMEFEYNIKTITALENKLLINFAFGEVDLTIWAKDFSSGIVIEL